MGCSAPALRVGTLTLTVGAACGFSLHASAWRSARSSFVPSTRRAPLEPSQGISRADPGGRGTPRFWHRL